MNVGEFKAELRTALKRGTSLDDSLDGFMRRAARFIEMNHNLQYMRRLFDITVASGDQYIAMPPGVPIKTIEGLKFIWSNGEVTFCRKRDFSESAPDLDRTFYGPAWFVLDGVERMKLDTAVSADASGDGLMVRYSDWPKADNQTHWLLTNAEGVMLAQSMMEAGVINRDERVFAMYQSYRQEQMKALLDADYEQRYTGQDIFLGP